MGLDQYAYAYKLKSGVTHDMFEDDLNVAEKEEIAYWRKHNRLEGWMAEQYRERGGEEEFNCVRLYLDEELLDELEDQVSATTLPKTEGFWFGDDSYGDPEDLDDIVKNDLLFIKTAREKLKAGYKVYYTSWW